MDLVIRNDRSPSFVRVLGQIHDNVSQGPSASMRVMAALECPRRELNPFVESPFYCGYCVIERYNIVGGFSLLECLPTGKTVPTYSSVKRNNQAISEIRLGAVESQGEWGLASGTVTSLYGVQGRQTLRSVIAVGGFSTQLGSRTALLHRQLL